MTACLEGDAPIGFWQTTLLSAVSLEPRGAWPEGTS